MRPTGVAVDGPLRQAPGADAYGWPRDRPGAAPYPPPRRASHWRWWPQGSSWSEHRPSRSSLRCDDKPDRRRARKLVRSLMHCVFRPFGAALPMRPHQSDAYKRAPQALNVRLPGYDSRDEAEGRLELDGGVETPPPSRVPWPHDVEWVPPHALGMVEARERCVNSSPRSSGKPERWRAMKPYEFPTGCQRCHWDRQSVRATSDRKRLQQLGNEALTPGGNGCPLLVGGHLHPYPLPPRPCVPLEQRL